MFHLEIAPNPVCNYEDGRPDNFNDLHKHTFNSIATKEECFSTCINERTKHPMINGMAYFHDQDHNTKTCYCIEDMLGRISYAPMYKSCRIAGTFLFVLFVHDIFIVIYSIIVYLFSK